MSYYQQNLTHALTRINPYGVIGYGLPLPEPMPTFLPMPHSSFAPAPNLKKRSRLKRHQFAPFQSNSPAIDLWKEWRLLKR